MKCILYTKEIFLINEGEGMGKIDYTIVVSVSHVLQTKEVRARDKRPQESLSP